VKRASRKRERGLILLPVVIALTLIAVIAVTLNRDSGMNLTFVARGMQADAARYVAEAGLAQMNYRAQNSNCGGYPTLSNVAFGNNRFNASVTPTSGTPVTLTATGTTAGGATATLTRSNVTVYRSTPLVQVVQPGPAGTDTYIDSGNPGANYGGSDTIVLKGGGRDYGLLRFDVSSIPAGAYVQSATLALYSTNGSGGPSDSVTAYRATRAWTEGTKNGGLPADGATWNTYNGLLGWTTPGADYDASSGVSSPLAGSGWNSLDVTQLVAGWTAGISPNYGMLLVPSNGVTNGSYTSGDSATSAQWPKLTITWFPPCGWVPPPATLGPVVDAYVDSSKVNTNFGSTTGIRVEGPSGAVENLLVRFDTAAIPTGTLLASATLRLMVTGDAGHQNTAKVVSAYRITQPWTESAVTWNNRDTAIAWTTLGGTYATPAAGSVTLAAAFVAGWIEIDITSLAQAWVDGVAPNYGAIVKLDIDEEFTINSRESALNRPQLVIVYQ